MIPLKNLQEDDQEIIVSLPYRVGVWMSRVDNLKNTGRDEALEERALVAVLETLAKSKKKIPFAGAVVAETLRQKRQWIVWRTRKNFMDDLGRGLQAMEKTLPADDVLQYKRALFHVAKVVAQAFGETRDHHKEALLSEIIEKISDRFSDPLEKNPENVSPVEKAALQKLKEALKG
jgi:hypothetical protein